MRLNRRGRTTTGMVAACLIATVAHHEIAETFETEDDLASSSHLYDREQGSYEEEAYVNGMFDQLSRVERILTFP